MTICNNRVAGPCGARAMQWSGDGSGMLAYSTSPWLHTRRSRCWLCRPVQPLRTKVRMLAEDFHAEGSVANRAFSVPDCAPTCLPLVRALATFPWWWY